jgi:hypothetical protein
MAPLKTLLFSAGLLGSGWVLPALAQNAEGTDAASFASENAILDTGIPFAIGAREARQSLRGSFGWPTFQEGLVEGVYFRFDPDGYARFAPTPRLDTDVFEVICRPRTYTCMGRKGDLSVLLNTHGQMQLKIEGAQQGDSFFVSEGVNEIQIPERILQPLDIQMETLLATGSELTVRRGENQVSEISLKGFSAITAYLRWVAARQDYSVLPRGWPVPNSQVEASQGTMTQAGNWASPMPQPQILGPGFAPVEGTAPVETEVAEVRGELNLLRELLLERSALSNAAEQDVEQPMLDQRIADLQKVAMEIRQEIAALQHGGMAATSLEPVAVSGLPVPAAPVPGMAETAASMAPLGQTAAGAPLPEEDAAVKTARRLEYLMRELGMDLGTAVAVLQMNTGTGSEGMPAPAPVALPAAAAAAGTVQPAGGGPLYQDELVEQILQELEADAGPRVSDLAASPPVQPMPEEYQLLSLYFRSLQ